MTGTPPRGALMGSREAFSGRAFRVRLVPGVLHDGTRRVYEVVERVPAVAIVGEVEGRLIVIRQKRPAVGRTLFEIPAGKVDPEETSEMAARRELAEETGYRAGRLEHWLDLYPSPGYTTEIVSFFWAPDPVPGDPHREEGEEMEVLLLDPDEVRALIQDRNAHPLNGLFYTGAAWWLGRCPPA